jgi:hypothetical protein
MPRDVAVMACSCCDSFFSTRVFHGVWRVFDGFLSDQRIALDPTIAGKKDHTNPLRNG